MKNQNPTQKIKMAQAVQAHMTHPEIVQLLAQLVIERDQLQDEIEEYDKTEPDNRERKERELYELGELSGAISLLTFAKQLNRKRQKENGNANA